MAAANIHRSWGGHLPYRYADCVRKAISSILIVSGVLLAVGPALSVWQLGGDVLAMVPDGERVIAQDTSPFAFIDDEFVVATRTYGATTVAELTSELRGSGFTFFSGRPDADPWLVSPACCGDYDAALARLVALDDGTVVMQLSAVDNDLGLTWPFILSLIHI